MKNNVLLNKYLHLIALMVITFFTNTAIAQNSFMDRQVKKQSKTINKKAKYVSHTVKRIYKKPVVKQQIADVDNSEYYSSDLIQDDAEGIKYKTVSYDNHFDYKDVSAKVHIEIDYPQENDINLDDHIRNWIVSKIENENEVSYSSWLLENHPDENDVMDRGESLLEYYDDIVFSKTKKWELSAASDYEDTISVKCVDGSNRFVSYCYNSIVDGSVRDSYNVTFRKSDGKKFEWGQIIKTEERAKLLECLKAKLSNLGENYTESDRNFASSVLNNINGFSLPEAAPLVTTEGLAFDYNVGTGFEYILPYDDAKQFMTDEAITLALDDIGEEEINGLTYYLKNTDAIVVNQKGGIQHKVNINYTVTFGDRTFSVIALGDHCFEGCYALESIILPNGLKNIGKACFKDCSNLQGVSIPASVTTIDDDTFEGCSNLIYVSLSGDLHKIGNRMFKGCTSLSSITLPQNVTNIGDDAFADCSALNTIKIPDGVTAIGDRSFYQCPKLYKIELPSHLTELGYSCFEGCTSLDNVNISASINELPKRCFYTCTSLKDISMPGTVSQIGDQCFYGCSNLEKIELPTLLRTLGVESFMGCSKLLAVDIPYTTTKISDGCFKGCSSLSVVITNTSSIENLSVGNDAFAGIALKPVLFVPDNAKKAYKKVLPWNNFDSIKEQNPKNAEKDIEKAKEKAKERILKMK